MVLVTLLGASGLGLVGACHTGYEDDALPCPGSCEQEPPPQQIPNESVTVSDVPPPPISGGTLLVTKDGATAIASDPDRDRIVIVNLAQATVRNVITTTAGAEPGRSVEDDAGRVYVALRTKGKIVTLDPKVGTELSETTVCPSPRGLAFDPASQKIHVACAGGELVTLNAGASPTLDRAISLGDDLRDVTVSGNLLVVSHFRSATLDIVDATGKVTSSVQPFALSDRAAGLPTVAWRTMMGPNGHILVLHQQSQTDPVIVATSADLPNGGSSGGGDFESTPNGSSYGGGSDPCSPIVRSAISEIDPATGQAVAVRGADLIGMPLPVDLAVAHSGARVAIVGAGSGVVIEGSPDSLLSGNAGCSAGQMPVTNGEGIGQNLGVGVRQIGATLEPIAVAYGLSDQLIVQNREPSAIVIYDPITAAVVNEVLLGGDSRDDTGHKLFHSNPDGPTGALVCASCHPEGREDGHTWSFSDTGVRRTQSLAGFSLATAPFHWAGDLADVGAVMDEVFVNRMGNFPQTDERKQAIANWMSHMPAAPKRFAVDDAAVARGKAVFEDPSVGCTTCHNGPLLTNNATIDVGTGEALQVPSLIGVRARAPYMHTGCAATLLDRFTPSCGGGDNHGHTSQLSSAQTEDLIAYLESL